MLRGSERFSEGIVTSQKWNRFIGRRRPLTPVTDRADCARAVRIVGALTRSTITDPVIQAYVDFTATMIQEWERQHDDDVAMDEASRFSFGQGTGEGSPDRCRNGRVRGRDRSDQAG